MFGLFMAFLLTWSYVSPKFLQDPLLIQLPIFSLIGIASIFAGLSFYRLRKRRQFVGVGLLFFGFLLWGVYLATYPFIQKYPHLITSGFLVSAVLQLFIAVSMIVLVLEEARYNNEQALAQMQTVRTEKEALELKILSAEEQAAWSCRDKRHFRFESCPGAARPCRKPSQVQVPRRRATASWRRRAPGNAGGFPHPFPRRCPSLPRKRGSPCWSPHSRPPRSPRGSSA